MHKAFEKWCSQEITEEYSDERILAMIVRDLMPLLDYNQKHISEANVHFDYRHNTLVFKNVKSYGLDRQNGQCVELAERLLKLIQIRFPKFAERFEVVVGNERDYFSNYGTSLHYFLAEKTEDEQEDSTRIIIDPSLKTTGPADLLGYHIIGKSIRSQDITLLEGQLTPYSFINDRLLHLGWVYKDFQKLDILLAIKKARTKIDKLDINDFKLFCYNLGFEEIFQEIQKIRQNIRNLN